MFIKEHRRAIRLSQFFDQNLFFTDEVTAMFYLTLRYGM